MSHRAEQSRNNGAVLFLVRNLFDRFILVAAVIAGGLIPGFIAQYRQRLGGRLDQALQDLAPWQRMADQRYGGDLHALIEHHLSSQDPTFHADGAAIQAIVDAVELLKTSVAALQTDLVHQVFYLSTHLDSQLARATLHDWVPTFSLAGEGIVFALLFGLTAWLAFQAVWSALTLIGGRLRERSVPARPSHLTR
jgi:hypothetical protein